MNDKAKPSLLAPIPPSGLVLMAIFAVQLGAAVATNLFPLLGTSGTVAVRITFSALLLLILARGEVRHYPSLLSAHWKILLLLGLCIFVMNFCFYHAIARIPLGAAVTLEFIGPLGVAAFASRKAGHFLWVAMAASGILLLSPISGNDLDSLGVMFALMAGAGWASFIVIAEIIGRRIPGNSGLNIALFIAALLLFPFALPTVSVLVANPYLIFACVLIALLSTTIPLTFEFQALRRMSARAYGILVSLEPAVAALVGAALLGEKIGHLGMIAVVCVVVASIGITVTENSSS